MRIPGICNGDPSTTVWAHSNMGIHGKGKGVKASDVFGCFACEACHRWLDSGSTGRAEKVTAFYDAMSRSWQILIDMGIITVAGS